MNQELLDKIEEIRKLTLTIGGAFKEDEDGITEIQRICDDILTKHKLDKAEKRLEQVKSG